LACDSIILHPSIPILHVLLYLEFHPAFLNDNIRALNTQCHGALSGAAPACAPPRSHSSSTAHPTDLLARVRRRPEQRVRRRPEQQHEDARQARPEVLDEHLRVVGRIVVSERAAPNLRGSAVKRRMGGGAKRECDRALRRTASLVAAVGATPNTFTVGGRVILMRPIHFISSAVLHTRR
jgi:hypothetical protein